MIKIIAFDLVGVLVRENDVNLTKEEDKLERLFGSNTSDEDYLKEANKITNKDIVNTINNIFDKLYEPRDKEIFSKIKEKNRDIKLLVTTNHVSFVRNYINNTFNNIDDIIISAEIGLAKPSKDYYKYILDKYDIKPEELLFLDDSLLNVESASSLGINTIKVNKETDIYNEVCKYI